MSRSNRSLLFYEDSLDLRHLKYSLEKHELDCVFSDSRDSFDQNVKSTKFDILIISGVGESNNYSLIDSLYVSKNPDTPIIYIVDNNKFPPFDELFKQQLSVITFPFSPEEFLFRSNQILRSVETDLTVHNNLKNYKNLLETVPVGIVQTDARGKFIRTNPRFQSDINMTEKDLLKENFFQLCHPDDYFLERKQLDRLLKKEIVCVDYEVRLINNEGQTTVSAIEASILWNGKDIFDSFTFVVRKIS